MRKASEKEIRERVGGISVTFEDLCSDPPHAWDQCASEGTSEATSEGAEEFPLVSPPLAPSVAPSAASPSPRDWITSECDAIKALLLEKNERYGNSAFAPVGIFTESDPLRLIATRCDDKLSRIKTHGGLACSLADTQSEDTVKDLIGYLILARIAHKMY